LDRTGELFDALDDFGLNFGRFQLREIGKLALHLLDDLARHGDDSLRLRGVEG
jgi:hypothetical protein